MKPYYRAPVIYLVVGVLWILTSDRILYALIEDASLMTLIQTGKGWFFVLLSSVLVFFLSRYTYRRLMKEEKEKQRIFHQTVDGAMHILLNYLNEMELVKLEAEKFDDFDQQLLKQSEDSSEKAVEELKRLSQLNIIQPETIHQFVYRDIHE